MKKEKQNNKGFSLLELLVVILIIGILAAVALPQYQMAVGKARFAELKTLTKSFQQSAQRYYMVNNTYEGLNTKNLDIELPSGSDCVVWYNSFSRVRCCKEIFNTKICLYMGRESGLYKSCLVYSVDKNDKPNCLCQQETGISGKCYSSDGYCEYNY